MTNRNKETVQELFGVATCDEKNRREVKRKILARCLDEALTALLWLVFAVVLLSCGIFRASFEQILGWLVFTTALNFIARFWRESYGVWRDYPYWRSIETMRAATRSVSVPFWETNAIFLIVFLLRGEYSKFLAVAYFLLVVDWFFARWTRDFAERTIRAGIETLRSNETNAERVDQKEPTPLERLEERALLLDPEDEQEETILSTQRRTKTPTGEERIAGEALVEFEEGAEIAVVNVSFCPSFGGTPSFDFEQVSGEEVAIKPTLIQPFGARLEARRRNAREENEPIRLEYFASYPPQENV